MMTTRAWFQLTIILIGVFFEFMGLGYGNADLFPFAEYNESIRGYVYNFFEHIKFIMLALLVWQYPPSRDDYKTDGLFVLLSVIDFMDYLLTGNKVWIGLNILEGYRPLLPLSMNTISILVFIIYAHGQWKTNGLRH